MTLAILLLAGHKFETLQEGLQPFSGFRDCYHSALQG